MLAERRSAYNGGQQRGAPSYGAAQPYQAQQYSLAGHSASVQHPQQLPMYAPAPNRRDIALPLTKGIFRWIGLLLLFAMVVLPAWDAVALVADFNYTFWAGHNLQTFLLMAFGLTFLLFLFVTEVLFSKVHEEDQTPQTLVMVVSLFVTLLGLLLILFSNPVSMRATEARNNLVYHCSTSADTQELRNYYMKLLALRKEPACSKMYSIENCVGFENTQPGYTRYLKLSEGSFRCSGFCVDGSAVALQETNTSDQGVPLTGARPNLLEHYTVAKYPPTLFSDANFKVSCDGAAARQLMSAARDTANQSWWIGVGFIALSIMMGMWEWGASALSPVKNYV